ncbi:type II toxin-antitoxin system VapC family toxin [Flavobacterium psychrotrophum]|uniref:type II toxin-antitoxin system VapC family toxin n=1 Tax=Flavobacterium psychrotrophum TaxID=2294119 RepID=UPI000E313237|nr:PIN domain-containing protein [Flavobacterium psychrotrophum]
MKHILIDSDVIIDFLVDRHPFSVHAIHILALCEKKIIKGYLTPIIIANVYYILKRSNSHIAIMEQIKGLLSILDLTEVNKDTILLAVNSDFKDFEDALQNFSAVKNGKISTIITRNVKDYKKSTLAVITPEMYLNKN